MKLYVWCDVLTDYTSGIAFALAESEEEARELCLAQEENLELYDEFTKKSPKVYDSSFGFAMYGGG